MIPFLWLVFPLLRGEPLAILDLTDAPLGAGLPPGWMVRAVRGQVAPETEIRNDGDGPVIRISGAERAAWFFREFASPIAETPGRVRWSWRVLEAPDGADLREQGADDSPVRVYVVFGKPGRIFGGSGRIIFYTYGNGEPSGYARASYQSGKLYVMRVDGATEEGRWHDHGADPFAGYRRIWRRDPPAITAIGVMQDTDQTGAKAVAELRRLEWVTP
ncbi:MAG: DUF3047 domain-containing protein [Gemmatimonadales bacterium]